MDGLYVILGSRSLTVDGNLVQSGYKLKCGDIIELGALRIIYCVQIIGVIIQNELKRQYYCQSAILGFRGA